MGTRFGRLHSVIALCAAAALIGGAVWGQAATISVDHPSMISRLVVEVPGNTGTNDEGSRWQYQNRDGDPTTPGDDNLLVGGVSAPLGGDLDAFSNITTISINNSDPNATDQVLTDLATVQDGNGREYWPLMPTARSRDIIYTMAIGVDDEPDQTVEVIEVHFEGTLLRDTVKLDYVVTNTGTLTHSVGLRIFVDPTFGSSNQDGTFIILSDGTLVNEEVQLSSAGGTSVPDGWVSFDNISAPAVVLRGTINGGEVTDPGLATFSGGVPDSVDFGQRVSCGRDDQWTFNPNPSALIAGEDWGYAVRWDEETLAPGASRRYVTYFGLGGSVSDFTPPYVLAAYAPFELQAVTGDDPITLGIVEEFYLGDANGKSTWDVQAYCDNFGAGSLLDARATISLPPGFELDQTQGSQSRTVLLGTIPRNIQSAAIWSVRATPDIQPGIHEIRVTGPLGRSVRRKISVPALPTLPQGQLDPIRGLSMVTVPFDFQITDAEHVFESLGSLQGANAALIRWDPLAQIYRFFPDNSVTNVAPGRVYWLVNRLRLPITFPADRVALSTAQAYALTLTQGWNQMGSPFVSTIRLDQISVVGPDGISRTVMEAFNAGLIIPTLYAYDPVLNDYTFATSLADAVLEPYVGYWLLALRPVTLIISPPTLIPFKSPTQSIAAVAPDSGWSVPVVVQSGGVSRFGRHFGQSSAAADGLDLADTLAPPDAAVDPGARLSAYFEMTDPRLGRGHYVNDIRAADAASQSWTLVVDTDRAGEDVSIAWPDLSVLPPNLDATIKDLQTGRVRFMRHVTSYSYNAGQGGDRAFEITVGPRKPAGAEIVGFTSIPTNTGVQMSFRLTANAAVDVTIRNIAGVPVKQVWKGREAPAGESTILWTGQADNGLQVPSGSYIVDVTAKSPDNGQSTGVVRRVEYRR